MISILYKLFQKLKRRESFPVHPLIPTLCYYQNKLNCYKKRKLRTNIPHGHKCNNSKTRFGKSNPVLITVTKEQAKNFNKNFIKKDIGTVINYMKLPSTSLVMRQIRIRIKVRNHSRASKAILKILQARLQQYMNHELPDIQVIFRKGRGTRDQIANMRWIIKKARVPEKRLLLFY